jgi:hypothetical protein
LLEPKNDGPSIEETQQESWSAVGMKLVTSTTRMFFENPVNHISNSLMTIHNCGTVAMHFEWARVTRPNPLMVL